MRDRNERRRVGIQVVEKGSVNASLSRERSRYMERGNEVLL